MEIAIIESFQIAISKSLNDYQWLTATDSSITDEDSVKMNCIPVLIY